MHFFQRAITRFMMNQYLTEYFLTNFQILLINNESCGIMSVEKRFTTYFPRYTTDSSANDL